VEIRDLLRRDPVVLDDSAIEEMVRDRVVLVTGGGGSIGSEICRQILRYRPRRLVVVERRPDGGRGLSTCGRS
jgi:FlaA1/EpsC-like NDP-sugar epimerase